MGKHRNRGLARLGVANLVKPKLKQEKSLILAVLVAVVAVNSLLLQAVLAGARLLVWLPVPVLLCIKVVIEIYLASASLVMSNLATGIAVVAGFVTAVIKLSTPNARVSRPSKWVFRPRQSSPCWRPGWRMPRRRWHRSRR